jgi:hypothetical protein
MRLSAFPYVVVRIACSHCKRHGSYRLARLAEAHGAETDLPELLERVTADCPWRVRRRFAHPITHDIVRCYARFVDLDGPVPPPPDLPPAMGGLRVLKGGRDEDAA